MAVREVIYLISTLLALYVNPAYLLLELDSVLKPAEAAVEGDCCLWWRRLDGDALKRWVFYLLAPHHYVMLCIMQALGDENEGQLVVFGFVAFFPSLGADFCSAVALIALLKQPLPPAALAIGYWLTTAGLVAGAGVVIHLFAFGEDMKRRRADPHQGFDCNACSWVLFCGGSVVLGVPVLVPNAAPAQRRGGRPRVSRRLAPVSRRLSASGDSCVMSSASFHRSNSRL